MMRFDAVISLFPDLDAVELTAWIERRWVQPEPTADHVWIFQDIDVARVRLIYDLRHDLDTSEDNLPVLLSLLDQVYELRRKLLAVTQALETQPPEVRASLLSVLRDKDHEN